MLVLKCRYGFNHAHKLKFDVVTEVICNAKLSKFNFYKQNQASYESDHKLRKVFPNHHLQISVSFYLCNV